MEEAFKYGRLVIIVLQYMKIENPYSLVSIRGYVRPFGAHSATHGYQFVRIFHSLYFRPYFLKIAIEDFTFPNRERTFIINVS